RTGAVGHMAGARGDPDGHDVTALDVFPDDLGADQVGVGGGQGIDFGVEPTGAVPVLPDRGGGPEVVGGEVLHRAPPRVAPAGGVEPGGRQPVELAGAEDDRGGAVG